MNLFKKGLGLIMLVLVTFSQWSCDNDIEDNRPVIQAERNRSLFKAQDVGVISNDDGTYTIRANTPLETLEFVLPSVDPGTYPLTPGSQSTAIYKFEFGNEITSQEDSESEGQLIIEAGTTAENTINGSFSFVAFKAQKTDTVFFRKGVIFEVPFVVGDLGPGPDQDFLRAVIDGSNFEALQLEADLVALDNSIVIVGITPPNLLELEFPDDIVPGNYPITLTGPQFAVLGDLTGEADADQGNLIITAHDQVARIVEGTFEFTTEAPNSNSVTSGEFRVSY
ncbi:MAG: DUF6252 family protein [Flavobacteriaceae bacterium]|nr:DUF6252 family protein [Flavobacteriaceae bacterium]